MTAVIVGSFTIAASFANAQNGSNYQQPPSQRYQPVRSMPPSVHVPDAGARPIRANDPASQLVDPQSYRQTQLGLTGSASNNNASTSFNFSDTPKSNFAPSPSGNNGVRQVTYEQPVNPSTVEPQVPEVLRQNSSRLIGRESTASHLQNQALRSIEPPSAESLSQARRLPASNEPIVNAQAFANNGQMPRDRSENSSPPTNNRATSRRNT